MTMTGKPLAQHPHLLHRDGTHTMLGGCEVKFRNMQHETWIAIRLASTLKSTTMLITRNEANFSAYFDYVFSWP